MDASGRIAQYIYDQNLAVAKPLFESSTLGADIVCPPQRLHPLLMTALRRVRGYVQGLTHKRHYTHGAEGRNRQFKISS